MTARVLMPLTAAACLATLVVVRTSWTSGQTEVEAARHRLVRVTQDAQRVLELRSTQATLAAGRRPDADVISRIHAALSRVGIPTRVLSDVGQVSDVALPGEPPRRAQSVRFTLNPIAPPRLGEFLSAWRSAESTWAVTQVELSTDARPGDESAAYLATLTISAVYVLQDRQP